VTVARRTVRVIMDGVLPAWIRPDHVRGLAGALAGGAGEFVASVVIACRGDTVALTAGNAFGARVCWQCGRGISRRVGEVQQLTDLMSNRELRLSFCARHPSGRWSRALARSS
jgi:hypothetical protein